MAAGTLTVRINVTGAKETLRAFRELPKEANNALRDRSRGLSQDLAGRIRAAATADSAQSALLARTVRARRDRVPVVVAGGTRRVGRKRKPAYKILFGSEFGATALKQYRPHVGRGSYWFFITVERNEKRVISAWRLMAEDVIRAWSSDG
jgi:hypothetical protein